MIPTYFGPIVLFWGCWLVLRGKPIELVCAMLLFGVFEASAVVILPALSYSSIPPARMMLAFLVLHMLMVTASRASLLREAIVANAWLLLFCIYGLVGAFLLPRLFAGQIDVVPMRPVGLRNLLDAFPLQFSSQNITTGLYLTGSGLTAVAAYVAARLAPDPRILVRTGVAIALLQAVTGMLGVLLAGTFWDSIVDLIRNGSYSQVRHVTDAFLRINGFQSEPSAYSRIGIIWLIFMVELWLRDQWPRVTGLASLALVVPLVLAVSSTAYVVLGAYGVLLAIRFCLFPPYARLSKIGPLLALGAVLVTGVLLITLLSRDVAQELESILQRMTLDKAQSSSGQQRTFWALQGLEAFKVSWGLGIGPGSFRSSSIITAIIGSSGVIGCITFAAYMLQLPIRDRPGAGERESVAAACTWTAIGALLPAAIIQGSPDPGMEFAIFAGLTLALRQPALADLPAFTQAAWGRPVPAAPSPPAAERQPGGWRRVSR